MIKTTYFTILLMIASISVSTAGSINNNSWAPSACGNEPEVPVIKQDNIETYNQSIKSINEWQLAANTYNTCVVNEANVDNALIAKTANDKQNKFRGAVEKIKVDTDAAKALLDKVGK
jgi:hypothetical protein